MSAAERADVQAVSDLRHANAEHAKLQKRRNELLIAIDEAAESRLKKVSSLG